MPDTVHGYYVHGYYLKVMNDSFMPSGDMNESFMTFGSGGELADRSASPPGPR